MIREQYICRGRVQGCGFRYKASHAARALGLTGYVRNCDDGSVEMEVQGEGGLIAKMLEMLNRDLYIRIDDIQCHDMALRDDEYGFSVRGW